MDAPPREKRETPPRVLVIDNYDSFVYNLVQYLAQLGAETEVVRNDSISLEAARELAPDALMISPGPGRPADAGVSNEFIRAFAPEIPVLGVCLGHQCIAEVYGGEVVRAPEVMHGKTSPVLHEGDGLFVGLPSPLQATRYHSLVVEPGSLPDPLVVTALTDEGVIMALRHREFPLFGVQFHPESILTEGGHQLLANWLAFTGWKADLAGSGAAGGAGGARAASAAT